MSEESSELDRKNILPPVSLPTLRYGNITVKLDPVEIQEVEKEKTLELEVTVSGEIDF